MRIFTICVPDDDHQSSIRLSYPFLSYFFSSFLLLLLLYNALIIRHLSSKAKLLSFFNDIPQVNCPGPAQVLFLSFSYYNRVWRNKFSQFYKM